MAELQMTVDDVIEALVSSNLYIVPTAYLPDEPLKEGVAVLDVDAVLEPDHLDSLTKAFLSIPYTQYEEFFNKEIWVDIPQAKMLPVPTPVPRPFKVFEKVTPQSDFIVANVPVNIDASHRGLIFNGLKDLYRRVNLQYCKENNTTPVEWEKMKTEAYLLSQDPKRVEAIKESMKLMADLSLDPKAKVILEKYVQLPKIGDVGLEINRQTSIRQLLLAKEYETAEAIVEFFRYAAESSLAKSIESPLPFDITDQSGTVIARKS